MNYLEMINFHNISDILIYSMNSFEFKSKRYLPEARRKFAMTKIESNFQIYTAKS